MTTKSELREACRKAFAERHGVSVEWVRAMRKLADKRAEAATNELNGDSHREVHVLEFQFGIKFGKDEHARWWEIEDDAIRAKLARLASVGGFKVEYNGLFPSLIDGNGYSHMIPE